MNIFNILNAQWEAAVWQAPLSTEKHKQKITPDPHGIRMWAPILLYPR